MQRRKCVELGPLSDAMEMQGRREKWDVLLCVTVLRTGARDVGFDASVLGECAGYLVSQRTEVTTERVDGGVRSEWGKPHLTLYTVEGNVVPDLHDQGLGNEIIVFNEHLPS